MAYVYSKYRKWRRIPLTGYRIADVVEARVNEK